MKNSIFNIDTHIKKELITIENKKKVSKKGKLNLSSNELLHEDLLDFNNKVLGQINVDSIFNYRYFPDDIKSVANILSVPVENMILSAGSDDAIKILTESVIKTTNRLIIPYPNYENYFSYASLRGIDIIPIEFNSMSRSKPNHTVEDIEKLLIHSPPSSLVISNPNGFSGEAFTYEEMSYLCELCNKKNHLLIIDEAYSAFGDLNHIGLLEKFNNVIIIRSFSKSFGLAGIRIAAIFSTPNIIRYIAKWNSPNAISGITLEVLNLYLKQKDFILNIQKDIKESRAHIKEKIKETLKYISINDSKANFILLNLGNTHRSTSFTEYLNNQNIIVRNLSHIKNLEGHVRMTIGSEYIMNPVVSTIRNFAIKEQSGVTVNG